MNRVKKTERLYQKATPAIDEARRRRRLVKLVTRAIDPKVTKSELLKIATLLGIKGRSSMNKTELLGAIKEAAK